MQFKEKMYTSMHDICNKVACIIGAITLIKRQRCKECPMAALLDSINDSSLAINDIVNSCRDTVTQENKSVMSKLDLFEKFQTGSLLDIEMQRVGKELGLRVELVNKMSLGCSVSAFPSMVESSKQVINNLFFNAKKVNATSIRIVAVEHESHVAIHAIDDGDGMSKETLLCLGLSIASKTSTGEGTRIVKKLVLREGGVVEWESSGIGTGCCVTIRLTKYKEQI
jgi:signal transduction histidine kinase